jgi:formylglycine-generating enzyme required for sulfatase activity
VSQNVAWEPIKQSFDSVTMVLVPAGCFNMGLASGNNGEKPVNQQCFDTPFWIDTYEVTNGQFIRFEGVSSKNSLWGEANRPREQITWFEAQAFCALRGDGMRLPTEAEWEYAARGPSNLIYPWGNNWNPGNAIWKNNSNNKTSQVDNLTAGISWVGASAMSGNVREWVSSAYQDYPYNPIDGREVEHSNIDRVIRGGSWKDSDPAILRATFRTSISPNSWYSHIGFRCVRPILFG